MSKDRQAVKEKKKPAAQGTKKAPSEYQTGKGDIVKPIGDSKKEIISFLLSLFCRPTPLI